VLGGDAKAAGKAAPEVFTSVLQEAARKAGLAGDKVLLQVNAPHLKAVFRATIRAMPNGSAPGGSGISCAEGVEMLVSWHSGFAVRPVCSVPVAAGLPPPEWGKEIVYPPASVAAWNDRD
jgi:hypothetical protein